MAGLRMHKAMKRVAIDNQADANARADSDIGAASAVMLAIPQLRQRRGVDIGIKAKRDMIRLEVAEQIKVVPPGFRGGGDVSVGG